MYIYNIYIIYIQYNPVLYTLKSTFKLNVPVRYTLLSQRREFSFDLRLAHSTVMAILFGLDMYDVKIYFNASLVSLNLLSLSQRTTSICRR